MPVTQARRSHDLSVLIVTYNSLPFIDDCLEALLRTVHRHSVEVIVIDNDSTDGSAAHVRRHWPGVDVVEMGRNAGFAAANNVGVRMSSGRHVLLLNGDAVVEPDAVDALVDLLDANPRAGVAAPRVLNPDGSDQRTARRFPTPAAGIWGRRSPLTRAFPRNRFATRYLSGADPTTDTPFEVDWVSGACLMVRRSVIADVGGLDEGFFMHWEDADWCRRIKSAGWTVWVEPTARAVHSEGGSRRGWPPGQIVHFHRGAYRYYAKHHLTGARSAARPLAMSLLAVRALVVMAIQARRLRSGFGDERRPIQTRHLPAAQGDAR